jgi:hypothetical protein
MRLRVPYVDLRRQTGSGQSKSVDDEDTGKSVGQIIYFTGPSGPKRTISLFGKYHGEFETDEECAAFAKGVEEVLNHMVSIPTHED